MRSLTTKEESMVNKVKPIKPNDVEKEKEKNIPDAVFEAFNELIAKNFFSGSAMVKTIEVVKLMKTKGLDAQDIYNKGWLDVEGVYRKAGWHVTYDSPGYNENYDAYFVFRRRTKRD
jgi:hypothetical protein